MILAISLLVGLIAAGFVWYGWDLAENVSVYLKNRASRKPEEPEETEEEEAEG